IAHDLINIYTATGKNYFPKTYLSKGELDRFTHLDDSRTIFRSSQEQETIRNLQKMWFRALLENPFVYLRYRWILLKSDLQARVWCIEPVSKPPELDLGNDPPKPLSKETQLGEIHTTFVLWWYSHFGFVFKIQTYVVTALIVFF